jgi:FMN-dependent dehydrogenase
MFEGVDLSGLRSTEASNLTWDFIKRLRATTKMKIVLKGILAYEDAVLAADNGIDAIIVSNPGGRSEDAGRATIDALPEIVAAVKGRMPIMIDSGFRRGTRHRQGAVHGRDGGLRRAALSLEARRVRAAGRGAGARPPAHRTAGDHAADGRADHQAAHTRDGLAGLELRRAGLAISCIRT